MLHLSASGADSESETDAETTDFVGDFESFQEAKSEENAEGELRNLEDEEIAMEIGEHCPPNAALFVRANGLMDTPPRVGGTAKDKDGLAQAVYPPILLLAKQNFFAPVKMSTHLGILASTASFVAILGSEVNGAVRLMTF